MRKNLLRRSAKRQGSALVFVLLFTLIVSIVISYTLQAARNDTQNAFRSINYVQARYLAEGALNRAKGDLLCQVSATSFLGGGAFETVEQKYANVDDRFDLPDQRIPDNMANNQIEWESDSIKDRARWDFQNASKSPELDLPGVADWSVGTEAENNPAIGRVRVYLTRSYVDPNENEVTRSAGSWSGTLTAWAQVGAENNAQTTAIMSRTYQHQLTFPKLFDFLMLGERISDCSFCHLKLWGQVGQTNALDPFRFHIAFDATRFSYTRMWGNLILNGPFDRTANSGGLSGTSTRQEQFLARPGTEDFIYASNGAALATAHAADTGGANPFRDIRTLKTPLPKTWPSVKDNLIEWFEPRAIASGNANSAWVRSFRFDNNLRTTFNPWVAATTFNPALAVSIGNSYKASPTALDIAAAQAIDRVGISVVPGGATNQTGTRDVLFLTMNDNNQMPGTGVGGANNNTPSGSNNYFNRGLHPFDDLDNDTIPNGFDADLDGDGIPETPRGSWSTRDLRFHLTQGAADLVDLTVGGYRAVINLETNPAQPSRPQWTVGLLVRAPYTPVTALTNAFAWRRADSIDSPANRNAPAWTNTTPARDDSAYGNAIQPLFTGTRASWCYARRNAAGAVITTALTKPYTWAAQVTGIGRSLEEIITYPATATEGLTYETSTAVDTNGWPEVVLKGVYPNATLTAGNSPAYPTGGTESENARRRSLIIIGSLDNPLRVLDQTVVRGDLIARGYISGRGSICVHNNVFIPEDIRYITRPADYTTADVEGPGDQMGFLAGGNVLVGNILHNRSGNNDLMGFVWGNMVNCNDDNFGSWSWGQDGPSQSAKNHMINPAYLMDGSEGGEWVDGVWQKYNRGNTLTERRNAQQVVIGAGGLVQSGPYYKANRRHITNRNPQTGRSTDENSYYNNFWISTPGLLPIGASEIPAFLPASSSNFGSYTDGWFTHDAFKFFTVNNQNAQGRRVNEIGDETRIANHRFSRVVEGVLYSDNAGIGGTIATPGANYLEFRGGIIARDIQLLSASASNTGVTNQDAKYTNRVGGLYYDNRLLGTINPLGFPFTEEFIGGEMSIMGMPDVDSNTNQRDTWVPFRLTEEYSKLLDLKTGG